MDNRFSRQVFETGIAFAAILFLVATIDLGNDYFRGQEIYPKTHGVVQSIKLDTISYGRSVDYPLAIQLQNEVKKFYLSDSYKKHFDKVTQEIKLGDFITLQFDNGMFGRGSQNNIREISIADKVIFGFSSTRVQTLWTLMLTFISTVCFGFWTYRNIKRTIGIDDKKDVSKTLNKKA